MQACGGATTWTAADVDLMIREWQRLEVNRKKRLLAATILVLTVVS